jgi:hypothetical protein
LICDIASIVEGRPRGTSLLGAHYRNVVCVLRQMG